MRATGAERRARDRMSAWFAVVVAVFYGIATTVTSGFRFGYVLAVVYAGAWLLAEYDREAEARERGGR